MKIVTGYQGKAHITSNDDQGRNQGIFGTDSYVTSVGQQFAATLVNANELDIADGEGVMQGVHFRIEPGEVDAAKLQNGTSGMKRIDLVVARYTKDSSTGIENVALVVIKGTESSSTPAVPAYNSGEILKGKNTVDFPLYKVTYNGINVSSVDRMFTKLQTMAELQTAVNKLNTDLSSKIIFRKITITHSGTTNSAVDNKTLESIDGYSPAFIVGIHETSSVKVYFYSFYIQGGNRVEIGWRTIDGSKISHSVDVYVAYIKN